MSSILSTNACGVGTHTTSLPAWPTSGWNSPWAAYTGAKPKITIKHRHDANDNRRTEYAAFMIIRSPVDWIVRLGRSASCSKHAFKFHTLRKQNCPYDQVSLMAGLGAAK